MGTAPTNIRAGMKPLPIEKSVMNVKLAEKLAYPPPVANIFRLVIEAGKLSIVHADRYQKVWVEFCRDFGGYLPN